MTTPTEQKILKEKIRKDIKEIIRRSEKAVSPFICIQLLLNEYFEKL